MISQIRFFDTMNKSNVRYSCLFHILWNKNPIYYENRFSYIMKLLFHNIGN